MRIATLCCFTVITMASFSQSFYDKSTIQTIEIFFSSPSWDAELDALATTTEDYLLADSVRINGVVFDSVGVKYKGNSSYNPTNNKNPLHIELNYIHGDADYQGYTDIKLQNGYQDPSMIREVLSYAVLEQYMDCPKANFANVYVNGTLRGLYSNAESINKKFLSDKYFSQDGSFFKCNPMGGAGPGGGGISPDLKWISADTTSYYSGYELKSTYGWTELVNMINVLNNNFAQIETVLDIDRVMWMLAYNNVLVNLDSYSGAFRQNYYLYNDLNDRWVPTVWDLNMSFAGFPGGTGSGPYTPTSLDPFSNSTSLNHPLIVKFLANPMYKRMYMAHLRTIVKEMFESGSYLTTANALRLTINGAVQADPYKFFTYTQFQNSLTTAVAGGGPGGSSIPGIQALMEGRVTFFNSNSAYTLSAPTIVSVNSSSSAPNYGATVTFTATCSNETDVYMGYRFEHALKFNRVQMYDDGMHQDGAAGDHVFGVQLTLNCYELEYYVYAENNLAGIFSPQRAEHEFYTLLTALPIAPNGSVVLNELMSSNDITAFDANDESNDWIELYNTTGNVFGLTGLFLSDDVNNLSKWAFPQGSGIQPNEYLIVWADQDSLQYGLHANFKLGSSGESLVLSDGVNIYDQVAFPALNVDESFARCPDAGTFTYTTPTFAAANNCYVGLTTETIEVAIYPVPTLDWITLRWPNAAYRKIKVSDMHGRMLGTWEFNDSAGKIDLSAFTSGYYLVLIDEDGVMQQRTIIKFD
jgi:spore coat protein CotH